MADTEVDLEGGLLRILTVAQQQAAAVRDVQREAGHPAIGESVLAQYLAEGVAWAAAYAAWREAQWADPPPAPEDLLREYLQGWRGGTLFSGIGAPEAAMPWVDWRWCAEIDPFACAVLAERFPGVPNLGDVNEIGEAGPVEPVDLVVFGSPCQSFSVAGKRLGLDDPRGNMALVGLRVIGRIRPRWVVWENVPGVLSSDSGRDFGAFLGLLGELGYGFAYRVLDAQHAGVPQRRRRVFVVGYLGDWRPATAVLFEPESLRGDTPPRREAGERVARPVASCAPGGSGYRCDADTADNLIAFGGNNTSGPIDVATACNAHGGPSGRLDFETETLIVPPLMARGHSNGRSQTLSMGFATDEHIVCFSAKDHGSGGDPPAIAHALRADGFDAGEDGTGRGTPLVCATISAENVRHTTGMESGSELLIPTEIKQDSSRLLVRRLMPVETERLQGFPDGWTDVPYRGKPAADGPRYRAIGNSMAVPVVRWIGERIASWERTGP